MEEFATRYPLAVLMQWLGNRPFIQIGRHAIVNLRAIELVTHDGDRLYRVHLCDRFGTSVTASRLGAARLAEALKLGAGLTSAGIPQRVDNAVVIQQPGQRPWLDIHHSVGIVPAGCRTSVGRLAGIDQREGAGRR